MSRKPSKEGLKKGGRGGRVEGERVLLWKYGSVIQSCCSLDRSLTITRNTPSESKRTAQARACIFEGRKPVPFMNKPFPAFLPGRGMSSGPSLGHVPVSWLGGCEPDGLSHQNASRGKE